MSDSRAEFEKWYIARQRSKGYGAMLTDDEFVVKHADGRYRSSIGLDLALEAYQAARKAALAEAAKVCEDIGDEYDRTEGGKWPELKSDAKTGAGSCEAAIRSLADRSPT